MTSVTLTTLRMPVADLGPRNPLPLLSSARELHEVDPTGAGDAISTEMLERLNYGHPVGAYPYLTQDGYTRDLTDQDVRVAVLDNGLVTATFLLDYGGRLWSLVDCSTGRNLLHNPGMIRLGNLALRNAWFAGGVEWNIGTTGHSPTTCEPLHAAIVQGQDGQSVLRLYEYERLRGVVFQVDAWVPEGSRFLKVYVRVQNPTAGDVPMYWWSNAAVPEGPEVRVIAPADTAWHFGYERYLAEVPLPDHGGSDISYTTRAAHPADYFFRVPADRQPWIAAVNEDGRGLLQASTPRLVGRKLFRWGTGPSGRTWQNWLGDSQDPYLEIQAGLAETQLEHLRLPAGQDWDWVEAYGPVSTDPDQAHGAWPMAQEALARVVTQVLPAAELQADLEVARGRADQPPTQLLGTASGWGALEQQRRRHADEQLIPDTGTPFEAHTLGPEQEPWLALLETGKLAAVAPPADQPYGVDWAARLAQAPQDWVTAYLCGVHAHALADTEAARQHFDASLKHEDNAWALRALALLDLAEGNVELAAERYARAHEQQPGLASLAREAIETLTRAGSPEKALDILDSLPGPVRGRGRFRMLEAEAAAAADQIQRALDILDSGVVVDDLREGETALSDLWERLHPDSDVPEHYDFRMVPEQPDIVVAGTEAASARQ